MECLVTYDSDLEDRINDLTKNNHKAKCLFPHQPVKIKETVNIDKYTSILNSINNNPQFGKHIVYLNDLSNAQAKKFIYGINNSKSIIFVFIFTNKWLNPNKNLPNNINLIALNQSNYKNPEMYDILELERNQDGCIIV